MDSLPAQMVVHPLIRILRETMEGVADGSFYLDAEEAMQATLAGLSPADASQASAGTSIAAHVGHLIFALTVSTARIRGDESPCHWDESWKISTVDQTRWDQLREHLMASQRDLARTIEVGATASPEALARAMAAIAHAAYHLGAIRQKRAALGSSNNRTTRG